MTEQAAIQALQQGSTEGLTFFINEYQGRIYNTCLGLIQNESDAEEITQDVFVKMYHYSSSFKGQAKFSTWLYRIAVNESLQFLRKRKAKKWIPLGRFGTVTEDSAVDFVHPGIVIEQKENAKLLFSALKKIPEKQQVAFTLKNIEQLTQNEIATIMELNEGAVESLLQRAKQNLKKQLTNNNA